MREFLILKLQGSMQAWGEHTFEGIRPSANAPTRSGLLGLLGACLGIRRSERDRQQQLAESVALAVRVDCRPIAGKRGAARSLPMVKATDFHTVQDARVEYTGLASHETILTWREYLYDAEFTVALWCRPGAPVTLDRLETAVRQPLFTPYLGRRSCPLARPLWQARLTAADELAALRTVPPSGGTVYTEGMPSAHRQHVRDLPLVDRPRQFASRDLFVHGGDHVPE